MIEKEFFTQYEVTIKTSEIIIKDLIDLGKLVITGNNLDDHLNIIKELMKAKELRLFNNNTIVLMNGGMFLIDKDIELVFDNYLAKMYNTHFSYTASRENPLKVFKNIIVTYHPNHCDVKNT